MPSVSEAFSGQATPIEAALESGINTVSNFQKINFTKYVKLVLPLDGYVFWVKAGLVSKTAAYNAMRFNERVFNQTQGQSNPPDRQPNTATAETITVEGSFHYSSDQRQEETESISYNRVVLTTQADVQEFNEIGPEIIYIGMIDDIRFAFTGRGPFYQAADTYHYYGYAIYPDMETQIIDSISGFSQDLIVSNSLPLWLAMNDRPQIPEGYGFSNTVLRLYPSFLVDNNILPPWASVHIPTTEGIGSTPLLGSDLSHSQLCFDRVEITMYGMRNRQALDFVDFVNQYSVDFGTLGLMNIPVLRDEKRTQSELGTLAMKKSIVYDVSYLQSVARDVARQLILNAVPDFIFGD